MEVRMRPLFFLPLAVLLASAALSAPVPPPGPAPRPWHTGWDKPADAVGDCRFDRQGALTITVPGRGHELDIFDGRLKAPRLMRTAEGDFDLQVRVRGNFLKRHLARHAGILLLTGKDGAALDIGPVFEAGMYSPEAGRSRSLTGFEAVPGGAGYLRVRRRGQLLHMEVSEDGREWSVKLSGKCIFRLPDKVKVGVFAASTAEGRFTATFDELKFTQPESAKEKR
jgi:regulation of enolase protein 1 (concanavalin A-like superfamily)